MTLKLDVNTPTTTLMMMVTMMAGRSERPTRDRSATKLQMATP